MTSAPTLASCQALMLPLACRVMARLSLEGRATVIVMDGLGPTSSAGRVASADCAGWRRNTAKTSSSRAARATASQSQRLRGDGVCSGAGFMTALWMR
ncbi:hypothetical protein D9M68_931620 [compost metagenome]